MNTLNVNSNTTTDELPLLSSHTWLVMSTVQTDSMAAVVFSCVVALVSVLAYKSVNQVFVAVARRLKAWRYLTNGMAIIQDGFEKVRPHRPLHSTYLPDLGRYLSSTYLCMVKCCM